MPNDEYFEAPTQESLDWPLEKWRKLSLSEQLRWTQVFLDYPPRFLGVIGMLATLDGYRNKKPCVHSTWHTAAGELALLDIDPYVFALMRARITRTIAPSDWKAIGAMLRQGERLSVVADACMANDARWARWLRWSHE